MKAAVAVNTVASDGASTLSPDCARYESVLATPAIKAGQSTGFLAPLAT
jgi:hypothetical protein